MRVVDDATMLDLRGLKCPLPVLRAQKALRTMAPGAALIVECTDPMSVIDIPHFVNGAGHALEDQSATDGVFVFVIRRSAA